ncbi:pentapeptide repeat-containing protein [archaeon]|jgi:hypothetical protein|nr:pentapeptide repeat-containing protein [archaeon]MBT4022418.1 pentapeptide repeat-containing protein [archaeon]MBT4272572.1 pentapeptide repeat-containing protein [archaeon]MBT4461261.1 pentapeptide repeat-containing protein [archaeon]MBT4858557.1 pentapeptide repeat-containing protein [archaeon]
MNYVSLSDLTKLVNEKDSERIIDILINFKERWNELIPKLKEKQEVKLQGLNLKNSGLSGLDLSDIILADTDLSGSDLSNTDLSNTIISRTNFSNSNMSNSNLYSARITQTNFSGAKVYNVKMLNTVMTGSVNLFGVYDSEPEYDTHPDKTKEGFILLEALEHSGEEESNYY